MFNWIIQRQLDALERRLGTSVDYLRHVASTSRSAFFKFIGFVPLATHSGRTPRCMLFAARFLATQYEDCGTCTQIVVSQAIREKITIEIIQALLADDFSRLDRETRLAAEFTSAVLKNTRNQESLREHLRACVGEQGVVDLSLAIASARVFPTLKRGLGYAVSCQHVNIRIPQMAGVDES